MKNFIDRKYAIVTAMPFYMATLAVVLCCGCDDGVAVAFLEKRPPFYTSYYYELTVNLNPKGCGTSNPASSRSNIASGSSVSISAAPNNNYAFVNWTVTSGSAAFDDPNSASTTVTFRSNTTITANFQWQGETFTDSRNNQSYRIVTIGSQTWMAENLNYQTGNSWCYSNYNFNCEEYGRLYAWEAAKSACPSGWHLPTREEWNILVNYVGSSAGTKLKSTHSWWDGKGTDDYGFSALPGGDRYSNGDFRNVWDYGNWWSASEHDGSSAYYLEMGYGDYVDEYYYDKSRSFSVRCVGGAQ